MSTYTIRDRAWRFGRQMREIVSLRPGDAVLINAKPGGPRGLVEEAAWQTGGTFRAEPKTPWRWIVERVA